MSTILDARSTMRAAQSSPGDSRSLVHDAQSPIGDAQSPIGDARSPIGDARFPARDPSLRRRNAFTALALVFLVIPFVPYVQEERIGWFMWRDAPVLASTFVALAAIMIIGWLRTPRG